MAACSSRVVPRVEVFFLACSRFAILSDKSSFAGHIGQLATIDGSGVHVNADERMQRSKSTL